MTTSAPIATPIPMPAFAPVLRPPLLEEGADDPVPAAELLLLVADPVAEPVAVVELFPLVVGAVVDEEAVIVATNPHVVGVPSCLTNAKLGLLAPGVSSRWHLSLVSSGKLRAKEVGSV